MTDAILRAGGVRTALFTSPHLLRFTERIRIDGGEVAPHLLEPALERVLGTGVPLTYFEAATLVAVLVMADAGVELGVMETGLGGRLDAVTALPAIATAITSIGADHLDLLGPTLAHVAREKAAIARAGVPLFLPTTLAAPLREQIQIVASAAQAPVRLVPAAAASGALLGAHQRNNAAMAIALAECAAQAVARPLGQQAVETGLAGVQWPGRLEQVGAVLLDCAHNGEGAQALAEHLRERRERPRVLVLSIVAGKDVDAIAAALWPVVERVIVTRCASERALHASEVAARLPAGPVLSVTDDPGVALQQARAHGGLAVVAGSIFLVGQIRGLLRDEPMDPVTTSDPMAAATVTPGART